MARHIPSPTAKARIKELYTTILEAVQELEEIDNKVGMKDNQLFSDSFEIHWNGERWVMIPSEGVFNP